MICSAQYANDQIFNYLGKKMQLLPNKSTIIGLLDLKKKKKKNSKKDKEYLARR